MANCHQGSVLEHGVCGLQRCARGELAAWVPNFLANLHAHRGYMKMSQDHFAIPVLSIHFFF